MRSVKVFGDYDRDTLNDNGERLLSFSANHGLALSTTKNAISHTFDGQGKKRIATFSRDSETKKMARDVTVHPQPSLPTKLGSQHHHSTYETAWSLHSQPTGNESKRPPPIERRRLRNDPHLRQEVATVIGDQLRVVLTSGSSVDDVETAFTTAKLQIAERVAPPRARRLPGLG